YTRAGGVEPAGALGECVGDVWVGDEVEIVGAAYFMPRVVTGPDHFDGFTGDLDNWHIHYNLCRLDGRDVTVIPADCGPGTPDGPVDQPRGDASEGWMIHAWAEPRHDNQLGVFSMWNPTLWPVATPSTVAARGSLSGATDGTSVITDFELPNVTVDRPGTFRFFNADGEAHTVTAGSPTDPSDLFDTGVIAGNDANEISISEPGTYSYFCEIHPTMQGTITVG
ncbi:MAG: cupredoxin domain-containing protein, partial [Acidimicrobiia bacterium]|nr:cupredoxin domain-containing protein [Acidimicrobiia bacterium]